MVASIGVVASPPQGLSYDQRDGYYARDDPAHFEASVWAGKAPRTVFDAFLPYSPQPSKRIHRQG